MKWGGARSWVYFGPIGFQSSELAKVGGLLMAAFVLASRRKEKSILPTAAIAAGALVLPALLIILQNDLGTALVFVGLMPVLALCGGVPLRIVGLLILFPICRVPDNPQLAGCLGVYGSSWDYRMVWNTKPHLGGCRSGRQRNDHRRRQLCAAVCPATASGCPYCLIFQIPKRTNTGPMSVSTSCNPKQALGSGGWVGLGFRQGTQTQGRYIPEQSTDFCILRHRRGMGVYWRDPGLITLCCTNASFALAGKSD